MPTILIVDDDKTCLEPLDKLLRGEGFTTLCAASAENALAMLQSNRIDLAIIDLMMPEVDGLDLLRRLRRDHGLHSLPVIVLSAISEDSFVQQVKKLDADDYFVKTRFTFDELLARIRWHLSVFRLDPKKSIPS